MGTMNTTTDNLKVSFIDKDTRDTEETSIISTNLKNAQMEILNDDYKKDLEDTSVNWAELKSYAPRYYLESIPYMFNRMNPYLLNMISLAFVAFYGSATMTAGFGLGNAIFMFFWQTFTQVNGETQGITCSKAFGSGDHQLMRLSFYRGFTWNILVTLTSCVLYYYMDKILLAAGFEASMVEQAHAMVVSILPALFFQTVNEMIRNYLMSQKVQKPFVWINLASFIFFPIGGYYIIYKSGWGIAGFGLFKLIVETISMIGLIIAMKIYGHPESLRRESLKLIFEKGATIQYMKDFGKILAGWYASYFGLEINTILVGLMKDTVAMACWVSYMNTFAIMWTIGSGLAITTRTQCGLSIGANKPMATRKMAFQGFILAVLSDLEYQCMLAGVLCFVAGSGPTGSTIFRVIDKAGLYSIVMIINQVFLSTTLSCLFLFYFKLGAAGIGYAFLASWGSTWIITVIFMTRFDWKSLKKN